MFFAASLVIAFLVLGLLIYKSELFHVTGDNEFNFETDYKPTEEQAKRKFSLPKKLEGSSDEPLLEKPE